jgi:hypothetical protein
MIQIKSVNAGFPLQEATQIMIRPIIDDTTAKSCNTYWELYTKDGILVARDNMPISEEEYLLWDATNESLENIVLTKLNLTRNKYSD